MTIDDLPVVFRAPDRGDFITLPLRFVPEFYAREAARFTVQPWREWSALPSAERRGSLAHYFAHNAHRAHTEDAVTLRREAEIAKARGSRNGGA